MKLYSYWRSTTSYRVRIALAWKEVEYEYVAVDLLAGAQREPGYEAVNPIKGLPALELPSGRVLTQSMAILEYLEDIYPKPSLLPFQPSARAEVRAASLVMATDVHPVNNLKVGQKLKSMGHSQSDVVDWMKHWMGEGLPAFQALIWPKTPYCFGNDPTWADICLVAQLYNAHRWGVDMTGLERLLEIEERCLALPAFRAAHPDNQPDAS